MSAFNSYENHFRAHARWSRSSTESDNSKQQNRFKTSMVESKSVWLGDTMSRFAAV